MSNEEAAIERENLPDNEKIKVSIETLKNKKNRVMFFVPDLGAVPSGAVYEVYFHASLLKKMGYDVKILLESEKSTIPDFIEPELTKLDHVSMDTVKITVSPEDLLVIPEIFTNVMERTKNLPCMRVVLLQSIDNALRALVPGVDWSTFGITDVITTSKIMELFISEFFVNARYKVRSYNVGVPSYFTKKAAVKRPVVSVLVRNENDLEKVVKLFYQKFPQFRWLTFEPMQTDSKPPKWLRRKDFAERLDRNFAALWIDRLATHAQFPLECMRVGTIPISLKPEITPEYILNNDQFIQNSGVWTSDLYALPALIADTLRKFLEDEVPQELFDTMDSISSNYTAEVATTQLTSIYEGLFADRLAQFETTLKAIESRPVQVPTESVAPLTDELLNN